METIRIHVAEALDGYGQVTDGYGRALRCTAEQADYARKLLVFNLWVTATLDAMGNVVKVS